MLTIKSKSINQHTHTHTFTDVSVTEVVGKFQCNVYKMKNLKVRVMWANNVVKEAKKERKRLEKERKKQEREERRRRKSENGGRASPIPIKHNSTSSTLSPSSPNQNTGRLSPLLDENSFVGIFTRPSSYSKSSNKKKKGASIVKKLDANIWMAPNFPVKIRSLLFLFDILTPFNSQFNDMKKLLYNTLPEGFPVKYELPLLLDIKIGAQFTAFDVIKEDERASMMAKHFVIPKNYHEKQDKIIHKTFFQGSKKILMTG